MSFKFVNIIPFWEGKDSFYELCMLELVDDLIQQLDLYKEQESENFKNKQDLIKMLQENIINEDLNPIKLYSHRKLFNGTHSMPLNYM